MNVNVVFKIMLIVMRAVFGFVVILLVKVGIECACDDLHSTCHVKYRISRIGRDL